MVSKQDEAILTNLTMNNLDMVVNFWDRAKMIELTEDLIKFSESNRHSSEFKKFTGAMDFCIKKLYNYLNDELNSLESEEYADMINDVFETYLLHLWDNGTLFQQADVIKTMMEELMTEVEELTVEDTEDFTFIHLISEYINKIDSFVNEKLIENKHLLPRLKEYQALVDELEIYE